MAEEPVSKMNPGVMSGYADSQEHLWVELERIDLLIQQQVDRFRTAGRDPHDAFRGLHISDQDVDALLAGGANPLKNPEDAKGRGTLFRRFNRSQPPRNGDSPPARRPAAKAPDAALLQDVEAAIARQKAASLAQGIELRLENLIARFGLGDFERDVLLICLAPELDLKYERLYAYLQDDVTRRRPTVDLVLNLLAPQYGDRAAARSAFTQNAPLVHYHLLEIAGETPDIPQPAAPPLLARTLKVEDRIVDYLLGINNLDARLRPFLRWVEPGADWTDLSLPEETIARLSQMAEWHRQKAEEHDPQSLILFLYGPQGAGKLAAAEALCRQVGAWLAVIDLRELLSGSLPLETAIQLVFREAVLEQVPLFWDGFELLLGEEERGRRCRKLLLEHLETLTGLTFISSQARWEPSGALHHKIFTPVECHIPAFPLRLELWRAQLQGQPVEPVDLHALANQFLFGPGQIKDVVAAARNRALWRNPQSGKITQGDLFAAARALSNHSLETLARHIQPLYGWDDIVLPPDQMAQLREICYTVRFRPRVHGEWGFEQKLARGKGANALFAGPSGTGKTMATEIIAKDLELDLYKIDLSSVVSKYVGETEKNLERIFQEAQTSNAILFFDEADALFGKRSEVKDAHDRYANIEIAYLLQRIEEYEGIVILATNMKKNMDEAFVRRIQLTIEFPFPEEADRLQIWRKIWPAATPLSPHVDLEFMARQFRLAGGSIKNIALAAAFLAAAGDQAVAMEHLIQATRREYQKMGKLCTPNEFGPYFHLIKA